MSEVNTVNKENNATTSSVWLNVWLNIWLQPKETVRAVIDSDKNRGIIFLVLLGSYARSLKIVSFSNSIVIEFSDLMRTLSSGEMFLVVVAMVATVSIGTLIFYYLASGLLRLTGRWIGGKATYKEIKLVNGWISIAVIWSLVISIPQIILVTLHKPTPVILAWLSILISIWTFIIYLKGLAEAQRFSTFKSLLNVIIVGVIMYIALFIVVLVIIQTLGRPAVA